MLVDRICFSGQQTLVDLQADGFQNDSIDHELIACVDHDDVVDHHIRSPHLDVGSVATHCGLGFPDNGQLFEGSGSAVFLDDADQSVCHNHEPEQRVLDGGDHEHDHPQGSDQAVKPGEGVLSDDVGETS